MPFPHALAGEVRLSVVKEFEGHNPVTIRTARVDIVLPWESRQALNTQFQHLAVFNPISVALHAVGASQPVQLTLQQKHDLAQLIHRWCRQTRGGFEGLPDGIHELWSALTSDVNHTHEQPG